ncbi:lipopolysaccharide biosynthesis protein [Salmonella enterica subsp. arizonae]|uniref:Lipopolysaccharide biosynthesis protein n=1 Tax=Salmonella enterica subsp. arizonae TaxID=59203 RepID=A0A2X4TMR2_SALER|nr:lipopolysaccharide biosynthesis protein [Salmonella enterica subsp. arizonae]
MSLAKASLWTAVSTLVKIGAGLLVVKLLAVSFGPAGVGLAGNFRQMITVLGVLAGAGIFNGVTKLVAQHHNDPAQLRTVVGTSSAMVLGFSTLLALIFLLAAAPISPGTVWSHALSRVGAPGRVGTNGDRVGEPAAGADEGLS